jgi:hypothetical protein
MTHVYLGDRWTRPEWKRVPCSLVRTGRMNAVTGQRAAVRGRNGNMLVQFADGTKAVVLGRLLRKAAMTT